MLVLSLGCQCYLVFASGVKNRTVICKNCRNIFRCLVEMMKKITKLNNHKTFKDFFRVLLFCPEKLVLRILDF